MTRRVTRSMGGSIASATIDTSTPTTRLTTRKRTAQQQTPVDSSSSSSDASDESFVACPVEAKRRKKKLTNSRKSTSELPEKKKTDKVNLQRPDIKKALFEHFEKNPKPESESLQKISAQLGLTQQQVTGWFNRRNGTYLISGPHNSVSKADRKLSHMTKKLGERIMEKFESDDLPSVELKEQWAQELRTTVQKVHVLLYKTRAEVMKSYLNGERADLPRKMKAILEAEYDKSDGVDDVHIRECKDQCELSYSLIEEYFQMRRKAEQKAQENSVAQEVAHREVAQQEVVQQDQDGPGSHQEVAQDQEIAEQSAVVAKTSIVVQEVAEQGSEQELDHPLLVENLETICHRDNIRLFTDFHQKRKHPSHADFQNLSRQTGRSVELIRHWFSLKNESQEPEKTTSVSRISPIPVEDAKQQVMELLKTDSNPSVYLKRQWAEQFNISMCMISNWKAELENPAIARVMAERKRTSNLDYASRILEQKFANRANLLPSDLVDLEKTIGWTLDEISEWFETREKLQERRESSEAGRDFSSRSIKQEIITIE
ncbi:Homeodomain-only protein [Caenorhabditis elegans]|uniref:Homeodomain-only protein n=1 Tax=Caenorhabditis elegans TaxID=6239 RepID=O16749_CAEEL|nr:Homeodomain-only protein [Caenorhabditis elegans]CCD71265.1 Homeodomain-only protein [Caenorhabditis elegans]|eukprot:NP_494062.1 C. Elegans Homeobox [Caenorhabditis elegans]